MDIKILKQRKKLYGDNIAPVAEAWSGYLGIEVRPEMVCEMMALLKHTRRTHIRERLIERREEIDNETLKEAMDALEDTEKDYQNYMFMAKSYEDYKKL